MDVDYVLGVVFRVYIVICFRFRDCLKNGRYCFSILLKGILRFWGGGFSYVFKVIELGMAELDFKFGSLVLAFRFNLRCCVCLVFGSLG